MKGRIMCYAYNEAAGVVNGMIFFFERGDDEIALRTFNVITKSDQKPTSIVRDSPEFVVGIRLTTEEDRLLK